MTRVITEEELKWDRHELTPEVRALIGFKLSAFDMIPHAWYKQIRTDEDKPDFIAIHVLSYIYHWYTPIDQVDKNERCVGQKKRFWNRYLQLSYGNLHDAFGLSQDQSRQAISRLEAAGLIRKYLFKGRRMYVELIADKFIEITYPWLGSVSSSVESVDDSQWEVTTFTPPVSKSNRGGFNPTSNDNRGGFNPTLQYISEDTVYIKEEREELVSARRLTDTCLNQNFDVSIGEATIDQT